MRSVRNKSNVFEDTSLLAAESTVYVTATKVEVVDGDSRRFTPEATRVSLITSSPTPQVPRCRVCRAYQSNSTCSNCSGSSNNQMRQQCQSSEDVSEVSSSLGSVALSCTVDDSCQQTPILLTATTTATTTNVSSPNREIQLYVNTNIRQMTRRKRLKHPSYHPYWTGDKYRRHPNSSFLQIVLRICVRMLSSLNKCTFSSSWILLVLLLSQIQYFPSGTTTTRSNFVVVAYSDGAGSCPAGMAAVGGSHLSQPVVQNINWDDVGVEIVIGGSSYPIGSSIPLLVGIDYTILLSILAPTSSTPPVNVDNAFKGFLVRFESLSNHTSETALFLKDDTQSKMADVCTTPAIGITHTDPQPKDTVPIGLRMDKGGFASLDITLVYYNNVTASIYSYGNYKLQFLAPQTEAPSFGPTSLIGTEPPATSSSSIVPSQSPPASSSSIVPSDVPSKEVQQSSDRPSIIPGAPVFFSSVQPSLQPNTVTSIGPVATTSDRPSIVPQAVPTGSIVPSIAPNFNNENGGSDIPSVVPIAIPTSSQSDIPSILPTKSIMSSTKPSTSIYGSNVPSSSPGGVIISSDVPSIVPSASPTPETVSILTSPTRVEGQVIITLFYVPLRMSDSIRDAYVDLITAFYNEIFRTDLNPVTNITANLKNQTKVKGQNIPSPSNPTSNITVFPLDTWFVVKGLALANTTRNNVTFSKDIVLAVNVYKDVLIQYLRVNSGEQIYYADLTNIEARDPRNMTDEGGGASDQPSLTPTVYGSGGLVNSDVPSGTSNSDIPSIQTTREPGTSEMPSEAPSFGTMVSFVPSASPLSFDTIIPSLGQIGSDQPSTLLSNVPSAEPTIYTTEQPTMFYGQTSEPTLEQLQPIGIISNIPSYQLLSDQPSTGRPPIPSEMPSNLPSDQPSTLPSDVPSRVPSDYPSITPSGFPLTQPSGIPSVVPSDQPSVGATTLQPSTTPFPASIITTPRPTITIVPSLFPSSKPSTTKLTSIPTPVIATVSPTISMAPYLPGGTPYPTAEPTKQTSEPTEEPTMEYTKPHGETTNEPTMVYTELPVPNSPRGKPHPKPKPIPYPPSFSIKENQRSPHPRPRCDNRDNDRPTGSNEDDHHHHHHHHHHHNNDHNDNGNSHPHPQRSPQRQRPHPDARSPQGRDRDDNNDNHHNKPIHDKPRSSKHSKTGSSKEPKRHSSSKDHRSSKSHAGKSKTGKQTNESKAMKSMKR